MTDPATRYGLQNSSTLPDPAIKMSNYVFYTEIGQRKKNFIKKKNPQKQKKKTLMDEQLDMMMISTFIYYLQSIMIDRSTTALVTY